MSVKAVPVQKRRYLVPSQPADGNPRRYKSSSTHKIWSTHRLPCRNQTNLAHEEITCSLHSQGRAFGDLKVNEHGGSVRVGGNGWVAVDTLRGLGNGKRGPPWSVGGHGQRGISGFRGDNCGGKQEADFVSAQRHAFGSRVEKKHQHAQVKRHVSEEAPLIMSIMRNTYRTGDY